MRRLQGIPPGSERCEARILSARSFSLTLLDAPTHCALSISVVIKREKVVGRNGKGGREETEKERSGERRGSEGERKGGRREGG